MDHARTPEGQGSPLTSFFCVPDQGTSKKRETPGSALITSHESRAEHRCRVPYAAYVVVCGQSFSPEVLERIGAMLTEEPQLSRRALSRRVCEWLNWRCAKGRLKEMSCRVALGKLARAGVLELAAQPYPWPTRARAPAATHELPQLAPVRARLSELGRIELVPVRSRHSRAAWLWRELMQRHYDLGAGPLCGAQLRYLVRAERHGIVGAAAFSAAAWRVRARDRFIGWDEQARVANLNAVLANSRFLILPQVNVPHLASHVLRLCARQLPGDWARATARARCCWRPLSSARASAALRIARPTGNTWAAPAGAGGRIAIARTRYR